MDKYSILIIFRKRVSVGMAKNVLTFFPRYVLKLYP